MNSKIEKVVIHNANRIMVCGLSSTGMFMDGLQVWDVPYFMSLAMWLALPECNSFVENLVEKTKQKLH
ncbi:MAG: hypothetical protein CL693_21180 [Cellvibrionaceae bacterium]|nr:hypothetical protein [Cellvibrionaceae bacterium]